MASTPSDKIELLIRLAFSINTTMYKLPVGTNCTLCSNYAGRGQAQYLISYIQTV